MPNKPDDFGLWVRAEESIAHLCDMLISLHFFVRWELLSFLSPLASNLTKVADDVALLEEDSHLSSQRGDNVASDKDPLLLFSIETSAAGGDLSFSINLFDRFRTDPFPALFSML